MIVVEVRIIGRPIVERQLQCCTLVVVVDPLEESINRASVV